MEVKIKLKIKDVEIELTVDEAKKLAKTLSGMTGIKAETIIERYHPGRLYIDRIWGPYIDRITAGGWFSCGTDDSATVKLSDDVTVTYCARNM